MGTDGIQRLHDGDRPMAAGPVGPVLLSDPLGPSRMPSLDDLHQPVIVDPWDTDGIYAVDASDWLMAGGPVDRSLSLDPLGPSEMLALDVYNQPRAVGPVGKPSRPGPMAHPHTVYAPDWLTAGEPVTRLRGSDPMGSSEMLSLDVYNQPRAVGPVGKPSRPGPMAHPHTVDTPGWPTPGEPVTRLHSSDPMGPSGMLLLDGYNQPPTVGPVGKPSRPGPGDQPESIADVRTHIMNTGTAHGQMDPCDTPPSSDSGIHSLEEQWENMSTESLDTTSEQIEGGPEQLVSENSELMETKTAVGSENVGMDCVLRQEPVVKSPPSKQPEDGGVGVKLWTTHQCECDISCSCDRNSDIADLADFSDGDSEASVELQPEPRTGGGCDGSVEDISKSYDKPAVEMVTICTNKNDIMNSVSDEEDLDIAHMSDFSDDEDGSQEESRPGTQTGCVHDRSGDETLYGCDRPVAKTVMAKLCDKPADNLETMCVNDNDIMNSVSDDRDLDIANMSDFSDDEDGITGGSQPRTQTGCVLDSSFNETLSLCDRPVAYTVTARDDWDLPDHTCRETWPYSGTKITH